MTKRRGVECDVCDGRISPGGRWVRFVRGLLVGWRFRLREWGIVDLAPVDTGWAPRRVDLCGECWDRVLSTVREEVTDG